MSDQAPDSPTETRSGPFVWATAPAIGRSQSEDLAGTFDWHTAWVLDGADDPLADKAKCSHGATWYVRALHKALGESLSQNRPALDVALQKAIQRVRDTHEAECDNPLHRKPSATVCIFRCGSESIDYLVLGDASILLESSDAVVLVTDRRLHRIGQDLRYTILDRLRQGHGYDDPHRPALLRELVTQEQRARNTPAGFSIAAYDPMAALDSITETLPINASEPMIRRDSITSELPFESEPAVVRAALLSDGAERAVSTFGLFPTWQDFMRFVSKEGPTRSIEMTREAELLDSSGSKHPRTKFNDDASIILWSASAQS